MSHRTNPARCDARMGSAGWYFTQCRNRWVVRVTERNGEVTYVCRVHLRPLTRQNLAVEITSAATRSADTDGDEALRLHRAERDGVSLTERTDLTDERSAE